MPKFKTAWITDPGKYDFSGLTGLADQITFLITGRENGVEEIRRAIEARGSEYNPATDLLVPTGRMLVVWNAADILLDGVDEYFLAIFCGGEYEVMKIERRSRDAH